MNDADFDFFEKLLREGCGFMLKRDEAYVLEARLMAVAQNLGISQVSDIAVRLRAFDDKNLRHAVIETMLCKETSFFRDKARWGAVQETVLPRLKETREKEGARGLRIWSAGCATGQEAYALAMLLQESGVRADIVATDVSKTALAQAAQGAYSQFEAQRGMRAHMLVKYFTQAGETWKISEPVRAMVSFRAHNMLESAEELGMFDVILCRYVLNDFERGAKQAVLGALARRLKKDGVLMLGRGEDAKICADVQAIAGMPDCYRPAPALFW